MFSLLIDGDDDVDEDVDDGVVERVLLVLIFACDADDAVAGVLVVFGDSDAPLIGVPGLLLLLVSRVVVVELLLLLLLFADDEFVFCASEAIVYYEKININIFFSF